MLGKEPSCSLIPSSLEILKANVLELPSFSNMSDLLKCLNSDEQEAFLKMVIECMQLPLELNLQHSPSDSEDCSTAGSSPQNSLSVKMTKITPVKVTANVTTLMIRNVPTSLSQRQLLSIFTGEMANGSVDFFYLPTDISSKRNLGYAFVNFSSATFAEQFKNVFLGRVLSRGTPGLSITSATVQGLEANIANVLSNPTVRRIKNPLYMPIFLSNEDGQFVHVPSQTRG